MQLKPGDFIYHKERGVGKVEKIISEDPQEARIIFQGDEPEVIPTSLLERNGTKISPLGFRALAYSDPEAANSLLRNDPVQSIVYVLEDFPGYRAKTEDIKEYLQSYLKNWSEDSEKEWVGWWETAQPLLKSSPRIDTTKSRIREYGLHTEQQSRADEVYRSYRRLKAYEDPAIVYTQAKNALSEHFSGNVLPEDPIEDLLTYFHQVIRSTNNPISIRFDALFRLKEWNVIESDDFQANIAKLLGLHFSLTDLESYPANRLLDILLDRTLKPDELALVSTGMTASQTIANRLIDWSEKSGKPSISKSLLMQVLTYEIPLEKGAINSQVLSKRFDLAGKLFNGIPLNNGDWSEIIEAFIKTYKSIAIADQKGTDTYLSSNTIKFVYNLYQYVNKFSKELSKQLLDALAAPDLPIGFVSTILETVAKLNLPDIFKLDLEQHFLATVDQRNDDFLAPLINMRWKDDRERIINLIDLAKKTNSTVLINRSGMLVCKLLQNLSEQDRVPLISHLVQLIEIPNDYSWKPTLSAFIENIYLWMMFNNHEDRRPTRHLDQAIMMVAQKFAEEQTEIQKRQTVKLLQSLNELNDQLAAQKSEISEKETLIRELRSGFGSDTADARFEERSRLLKELVSTIAEFERFALNQPVEPKELTSLLRRLESISSTYQVISQEPTGKSVAFNPQLHKLVEGREITNGDPVVIVEKGFLIRDNNGKLRVLKPAIVKKL